MNRSFVRRLSKLGTLMRDLAVSAAGCFVFIGRLRPLAIAKDGSGARSSPGVDGTTRKPLAGIGAALFLLAFVASEALATISAFRR
jgi:hypothetical protein